jgi:hypothetical protein
VFVSGVRPPTRGRRQGKGNRDHEADNRDPGHHRRSDAGKRRVSSERPLVVLQGPAGIGETVLPTEVAHAARTGLPDDQPWIDLRGDDPETNEAPGPEGAADSGEYLARLRAFRRWSGAMSLRDLARRSGVPHSTLGDLFSPRRSRLPRLEVVLAALRACGAHDMQVRAWERSWRELSAANGGVQPTDPRLFRG